MKSLLKIAALVATCSAITSSAETPDLLESVREKHALPALAVVVAKDGAIVDRAAVGERQHGKAGRITIDDPFHLGSLTKSMTATLAGVMIDEDLLGWDTTIADVFPRLKRKMHPDYQAVTLEQLLRNRGGVPGEPPPDAWARAWEEKGTPRKQRLEFVEAVLAQAPAAAPGTQMIYSNQSYAIAGALLETLADQAWEELITEKLFQPLGMKSAGFGPPEKRDAPWGHIRKEDTTVPVQDDNPPAIAPAGRVHCTLDDLARFAMLHLGSETPKALLKPETLKRLHQAAEGGSYACGWLVTQRDWAGGTALTHSGSNTMWYAVMWLAPEKDFAVIAATNIAGPPAEAGCDEVAAAMIERWVGE